MKIESLSIELQKSFKGKVLRHDLVKALIVSIVSKINENRTRKKKKIQTTNENRLSIKNQAFDLITTGNRQALLLCFTRVKLIESS